MESLIKESDNYQIGITRIVAAACEVIVLPQGNAKNIPICPAPNPAQVLNPGDKITLSASDIKSTEIRIIMVEGKYLWAKIDELKKIKVKEYRELSDEEIKYIVKRITHSSDSEDEVRQRIINELNYPYSKEGIAVHRLSRTMCSVMLWSPRGKGLMV